MNNQSPLIPQGSLVQQPNKGRARVKIAVFLVLAIHGIGLMALLMQGCKKEGDAGNANALASNEPTNSSPPSFIEPTNTPTSTNVGLGASNTAAVPQPVETPPTVPVSPPPVANDYVIAKGDTFSTVAKKFHVTTKALLDANPSVEPTKLKIGQSVHIPASSPSTPSNTLLASGAAADTSTNGQTYSVKSGDSLTKIAGQFGVSVKAIRSRNSLKTDKIVVGQKLIIPAKTTATGGATSSLPGSSTTATSSGQ